MQGQAGGRAGSHRAGVNKKFLLNTVHGLKSHNKREEEEDCWRQHDLDLKAQARSRSHDAACRARRERPTEEVHRAASPVPDADTRQFWAERKRKAMTAALATSSVGAPVDGGRWPDAAKHGDGGKSRERERSDGSADDGASLSGDGGKKRGRKKEERKTKKKKKRKRETSRHGSGSSSSSSSSGSDVDVDGSRRREGGKASDKRHHQRKRNKSKKHKIKKKRKKSKP